MHRTSGEQPARAHLLGKHQLELRFLPALFFAPVRRTLPFLAPPLPAPLFLAARVLVALFRLVRFLAALFFAALFFAALRLAVLFLAVLLLAALFLAVLLLAVLFFAVLLFFALERAPAFFAGTLPPALRAFESPIAIACLRLFTVLPERPLFNVPRLRSSIAFPTSLAAFLPYLAMLPPTFRCTATTRGPSAKTVPNSRVRWMQRGRNGPRREGANGNEGDSLHEDQTNGQ